MNAAPTPRMTLEVDGDIPVVDLVRALTRAGFAISNQTSGPLLVHRRRLTRGQLLAFPYTPALRPVPGEDRP